jgi:enoyl-CoA hydratase/carnithine racemase
MEKPVVARVNGDAMGFGQSLALAADLIVAVEDARFVDMHLGIGHVERDGETIGPDYGIVPGDGGCSLVPMYMPPALAKESLLLAREFTAVELEEMGVINYAVEADRLDGKVAELVDALLERSPHALAWSKRVANRHLADQLNRTLDAGIGYEIATFLEQYRTDWGDVQGLR